MTAIKDDFCFCLRLLSCGVSNANKIKKYTRVGVKRRLLREKRREENIRKRNSEREVLIGDIRDIFSWVTIEALLEALLVNEVANEANRATNDE